MTMAGVKCLFQAVQPACGQDTHRRTHLLRHKSPRSGVNMSKHVCNHKCFCCVRATLLLIMIGLNKDHEVQVAMYRCFAMTTFSPRKF